MSTDTRPVRRLRAVDALALPDARGASLRESRRVRLHVAPGVWIAAAALTLVATALAAFALGRRQALRQTATALMGEAELVPSSSDMVPMRSLPAAEASPDPASGRRVVAFVDDELVDDFASFPDLPSQQPEPTPSLADLMERPVAMAAGSIAFLGASLILASLALGAAIVTASIGAAFAARLGMLLWHLEFGPREGR